ncbi:ubiquitin-protein transferase activating protein PEX22 LALA0_S14e01442g [Lachancea lanzarotensis]|uniref:Peroxisome assembly protein 22 n=1 Tax=Lachancea lanzarotensis TaxID=1245769 RepID=A0A0C7NGN2_9SACH|nr:uncharacterized protein LALA0_S14e01442g [Lachancea lanzarotensis]CEP64884.1 LALA0S14e01442g1_1 [Lachancea lanzarotensis]
MEARRPRNRSVGFLAAGALTALALGAYYAWKKSTTSSSSSPTIDETEQNSISACIVFTEDMYESGLDWEGLISMQAVVILPPKITLRSTVVQFPVSQIIECGTEDGVWSVVRHLRKDIVVVSPLSLNSVPADIYRFSEPVTELP